VKNNQRLSYHRLAEELAERELVEPEALNEILEQAARGGALLPMALIEGGLVSDWELSRVVCELYNLPFLTVEMAEPVPDAMEGLDPFFLFEAGIVPLSRHGKLLTVCMPAIVGAEVIQRLSSDSGLAVLPVVGTVQTNLHWLEQNVAAGTEVPEAGDSAWSSIFDEADAAVLNDIERQQEEDIAQSEPAPGPRLSLPRDDEGGEPQRRAV
jgi:hypothetical protein